MLYIRGYLKIRVTGYSPERFLNLCKNKNIEIWGLEAKNNAYVMCMNISGFRKLKPILRKTKTKVTIEERIGLPFFFYKYRKRISFLIGIFLCSVLVLLGTFFVWNIEFEGNQAITNDVLFEYLETKNVKHGMLKTDVKCEQIAKNIRKEFDDIIWVSVSLKGSKLSIHIKENMDSIKKVEEETEACDIIADKSGTVISIITRNGVPKVQVGSEVKKGDVLVSGVLEVLNDGKEVVETHYVTADADIILETEEYFEQTINREYNIKQYTKKKNLLPYIKIGEILLEFGFNNKQYKNYEITTKERQVQIGELAFFSFPYGTKKIKEYVWKKKEYTNEEMETLLNASFELFCKKLEENGSAILNREVSLTNSNAGKKITAKILLQQECGVRRKIVDF